MTDSAAREKDETHFFHADATWSGDGTGCGKLHMPQGDISIEIGGSKKIGGCGLGANPEELLLGAVGACFINTWAIFLKKLNLPYAEPAVRVSGTLGKDPAGGYKMLEATVHARVPASLMAEQRAQVEKTLQLSEKYCIISKATKAGMRLKVEVEEV
jgi:peroxiredoxin-like protein